MKQEHIEWSHNQFQILKKDGGRWGVPRSGLIWERRGNTLVLVNRMPWMKDMPITAEQLREQQDGDIKVISEHMRAAGVKVRTNGESK
jgi:hypothetical protein